MTQKLQQLLRVVFTVRWQPTSEILVAFASYLLVVLALYTAFQVFTTQQVALNFITFGPVMMAALGVGIPVLYTTLIRRRPLSDVGITTSHLVPSLLLAILFGAYTYQNTLATLNVTWALQYLPIVSLALTVGLFEAIFFRGWLQLRFEAAFGLLPGLILGALCYCFYHVGFGMGAGELVMLFVLGLVFGATFRLTRNVLILWPFYTPVGGLYTTIKDGLTMPIEATIGFAITFAMIAAVIVVASRLGKSAPKRVVAALATGRI